MTSVTHGTDTSAVEVTNVSKHGIWILIQEQELFLPFDLFPWFKKAPIGKILNVRLLSPEHLYWPELDVDLELESILHPERFPLTDQRVHEPGVQYGGDNSGAEWGEEKIDDCVLALLQLTLHQEARAWKTFDFEVMERLFHKGYIFNPHGKAKSVVLTDEGLSRSESSFMKWFGK